jgi:putative heme iron utilization protein
MADPITPAVSDRICKHMNEDHRDAVLAYAKFFGKLPDADHAVMQSIDPQGMNLQVVDRVVRIAFDHELADSEDAHQTLIKMVKQARQGLSANSHPEEKI